MASSRVIVDDRFGRFNRDVQRAVDRSLVEAAVAVQEAARAAASPQGYKTEAIQAKTRAQLSVREHRGGREVQIVNTDFRALWFEKGTYQRRRGVLSRETKRRQQTASGQARISGAGANSGVAAQKFMRRGLNVGARVLIERIKANLP